MRIRLKSTYNCRFICLFIFASVKFVNSWTPKKERMAISLLLFFSVWRVSFNRVSSKQVSIRKSRTRTNNFYFIIHGTWAQVKTTFLEQQKKRRQTTLVRRFLEPV